MRFILLVQKYVRESPYMPTFPDYDCWHSGEGGGGLAQEKSPEFRFPEVVISESHCLKKQRNFTIPSHL